MAASVLKSVRLSKHPTKPSSVRGVRSICISLEGNAVHDLVP